ncbi:YqzL family protein [Paenibacillus turpanensis]|nr:YqzL family protein [Paenibacillus turpanensis]
MRDFSWKYFAMTGDVESYLLYKEVDRPEPLTLEDYEDQWQNDADDEVLM